MQRRRAAVVDAIVATASAVMAENGAASLSLGEVARRLGMRTPSLYGYFENRAALCDELFRRGWLDYADLMDDVEIDADADLATIIERAIVRAVDWANANRAAAELMFWRPIPNWQPSPDAFAAAERTMLQTVAFVRAAQDAGLLRADVDALEIAQALAALVVGVVSQQLSNEPGVPARDGRASRFADRFAAMLLLQYGT